MRNVSGSGFHVICAGEALMDLVTPKGASLADAGSLRMQAGGGAVNAALALASAGLRVGLAAAVGDDRLGRALIAKVARAGVDVGGARVAPPRTGLVFVDAGGEGLERAIVAYRSAEEPAVTVPQGWESEVLLLSGLSPHVSHAAAFCKAARAARKRGTVVVVDVNARRRVWKDGDPRSIRSLLKEADVVRASTQDLAVLYHDVPALRASMRKSGVLVLTNGAGPAQAIGPFGEVVRAPKAMIARDPAGAGDAFTAAVCEAIVRPGPRGRRIEGEDMWADALDRGHAAAAKRMRSRAA